MQMLEKVGVFSREDLQQQGAVAVYVAVKKVCPQASLNLLWALESALTGQPWQRVARESRTRLLLNLEDYMLRAEACSRDCDSH